ncbi:double-strand break repair protein AddB [Terrihabitans sp. B22-R8]|uniref:double-strand break repair protein AddB n=1 Tax=Terrihabitans sp. B22-R8 TaxID=3425128 RepID=UPI00403D2DCA
MPKAPPDRTRPNVLTIPPGVPFLDVLADYLIEGGLLAGVRAADDPLALLDARIYLPTRRSARELEAIFARKLGGAALLPRIAALGDFAEDEDPFAAPEDIASPELPPAIGETARRLILARLIQQWARAVSGAIVQPDDAADLIPTSPASAMSLAAELGRLIDSFETEGVPWEKLVGLVPPEHDEIWKLTTGFLNIAAEAWPAFLTERGAMGGAARRNAGLRALAAKIARERPDTPILIAGSTGTNPATAELMAAVSRLPRGAVVLQGLDTDAGDDIWRAIGGEETDGPVPASAWTHPQHAFHRLLTRLDVQRGEVGHVARPDPDRDARRHLVSRALLPAEETHSWSETPLADSLHALDCLTLIEAANEREEALVIAIALRETLETPGKTVALVTPDRPLARRVVAELKRWGIDAEDSAGMPLADSPVGTLARLVADAARTDLAPEDLVPLLRHPLARFGVEPAELHRAANALELGILRGPAPPPGTEGLRQAIRIARAETPEQARHAHSTRRRLNDEDWAAAHALVERLHAALEPLCALGRGHREVPLHDLLMAHRAALDAVTSAPGEDPDPDSAGLDTFFEEAISEDARPLPAALSDYPALFKAMLSGRTALPRVAGHPRLRVLGTLEARLLGFDRIVMGGLIESVWPPQAVNDAFLSRPMRGALGLPPPEWRIGLAAHDFETALGGSDVVLTRALKAGGAPSVASRWLQRLAAVSGEAWNAVKARGTSYLEFARALDHAPLTRIEAPRPCPPVELRPQRLSVTEIETLIRDPYAIYARHVLRLQPLDPLGAPPQASDRGTIVHDALARFVAEEDPFAPDAEQRLCAIGRAAFDPIWAYPDVRALWWPRFQRIARWFVDWERGRREGIAQIHTEQRGSLSWPLGNGREFTLSVRADRLDHLRTNGFAIVDYKTGAPPSDKEVTVGFSPQLPLEGAILRHGAFEGAVRGTAEEFIYVRLSGQAEAGRDRTIKLKDRTAAEVADEALAKLKALIADFENLDQPYRSHTQPKFLRGITGDYDHLARYAEWSIAPDPEEGGEE